jgi:hypothetical protein
MACRGGETGRTIAARAGYLKAELGNDGPARLVVENSSQLLQVHDHNGNLRKAISN